MTNLPRNLPELFRKAGLNVVTVGDWESNGRPASTGAFTPVGVANHHIGTSAAGWSEARVTAYMRFLFGVGRSDLPPPLCHIALGRDGTIYLGAAGRANHAGTAQSSGSIAGGDGNRLYVGIEWMLSGTEEIPQEMYDAAIVANAVLLDVLGSSVQAISCHYQTSVTGKWDIGDPNGIPFKGHKVLDVPLFRDEVRKYRRVARKPTGVRSSELTFQHTSMQFSDTDAQMAADVEAIFSRGRDILTGTEAGGVKAAPLPDLLEAAAKRHGYRLHLKRSCWVAVSRDLIESGWATSFEPVVESHEGTGRHTDRGIVWVSFTAEQLGRITVGAGHYLTRGRKPGDPNFVLNKKYAAAIGTWAREKGRGKDVVFYAGDQNIVDRLEDTFFGSPLTSAWDEVGRWQNTGHGNIDVIASYDKDDRVEAVGIRALNDTKLHLHTDHFLVEAEYKVRHLK